MATTLAIKFQLKEEYSVLLLNSNPVVHQLFEGIRIQYNNFDDHNYDSVILFAKDENEIGQFLPKADKHLKPRGLLWLSYPKKSGSIPTNLNRDTTWNIIKEFGMEPVRLISVDENWSSMRLVKVEERKKPSSFGQDPPGVNRATKTVIPPEDLQQLLDENPDAQAFFNGIAYTYKREYVGWIHQAKKLETRERRILKTIELLQAGKKTK